MGKNPAFQFYPSDWTRDLDDQDIEVEGAWIRIICRLWWSEKRGEATKPLKEWARILRKTEQKTIKIFQILIEKHIADGSILDNQNVTIISRRMKRMVEISKLRYEVGLKGGNPALKKTENNLDNQSSNQNARSSSSSSSSTSNHNNNNRKIEFLENRFSNIPDNLKSKWEQIAPGVSIAIELTKAEAWVLSNPKLKKSNWSRFLTNWMIRAQDRAKNTGGSSYGGIRTARSDRDDKTLQSRTDAEVERITAEWAAKKSAGS